MGRKNRHDPLDRSTFEAVCYAASDDAAETVPDEKRFCSIVVLPHDCFSKATELMYFPWIAIPLFLDDEFRDRKFLAESFGKVVPDRILVRPDAAYADDTHPAPLSGTMD